MNEHLPLIFFSIEIALVFFKEVVKQIKLDHVLFSDDSIILLLHLFC